jgi:hypothetical protein
MGKEKILMVKKGTTKFSGVMLILLLLDNTGGLELRLHVYFREKVPTQK